ncbi:MAG: helix-turn-helix transcriptional regulator [Victivallales bacterium]|nr:helix-turn-helix transcriptional regulator [Victivallales bacterium]
MKSKAAKKDVNGWSIISKWLTAKNKRQTDLASILKVTASAVSQIKSGNIMLNAEQLFTIIDFLGINRDDMLALYTRIFNARLNYGIGKNGNPREQLVVNVAGSDPVDNVSFFSGVNDSSSEYQGALRRVPLMTMKQAQDYEPALEPIENFALVNSERSVLSANSHSGSFALLVDEENRHIEFARSAILLVAGKEYPAHGDMVVAKLRSGELVTRYYFRENSEIHLKSQNDDSRNLIWKYQEDPGYVQWMYPIVEVNLKMRAENYKFAN